jgi:eukaryotic-like serine/threonine-protein kinase
MNDAERWREVDRIFDAALDRPPGERTAFLDEACAGDPVLRREVERLLAADAREAVVLDRPANEVLGWMVGEGGEQQRLGPYRLLRAIGRGGMGTVFLAMRDDEEYERLVAVKILRSGLEDTELRHRFLAERQILARLEHPNIARLYDGGSTEDGRPYLVMELVEGLPVDEYCDRHRLTVDQRLALFLRICSAVQSAHQNLLVHRDLKPANILVTPQGEPKLLDFGIAKQLEPSAAETDARTRTGLRVMTPHYASPEQVNGGAITTASDVYSLGVLLYELLAGRSPYQVEEGAPPYELERAINEQQPEKPSTALLGSGRPSPEEIAAARGSRPAALQRRLEGDLDTIVLTALRKEPARRYASVARLSEDLERHLQDLPVTARPDTLSYRTRKFVRRHRAAVAAAAAVVLLVAGLVASLFVQGRQTIQERDKARYALTFLVDTFKQADPSQTRGERLSAQEILDQGAERVSRELASQPDIQAALMDAIGEVNLGLGRIDRAAPLLEGALATRRRIAGSESLEVAESLEHVASLRVARSDFAGGEKLLTQALELKRRLLGASHVEVAKTLNNLGQTLADKGDFKRAEPLHRQALEIARKAEGPQGLTVADSLFYLAQRRDESGDYPAAEALFQQALAMERRLVGAQHPTYLQFEMAYVVLLIDQGKERQAEAVLRNPLAIQRKAWGEHHPMLAEVLNILALTRSGQQDLSGAEALYRQALAGFRESYGEESANVSAALVNLGTVLEDQGRYEEAIPLQEQALAIGRRIYGDRHQRVAHGLLHLAQTRRGLGQLELALPLARESLAIAQETLGPEHHYVAYCSQILGLILRDQRRTAEAEPYLRRSVELLSKAVPPGHPQIALAQVEQAVCLTDLGRLEEAESLLRSAGPVISSRFGPGSPQMRRIREGRAAIARRR